MANQYVRKTFYVLTIEPFSKQIWGKSYVHSQVCVLNVSQKAGIQKTDHDTYTWAIVFSNNKRNIVAMISGFRGEEKYFLTAINIVSLTFNTKGRGFLLLMFY